MKPGPGISKVKLAAAILVFAALGLYVLDSVSVTVWQGRFPLQVTLIGLTGETITSIAADCLPEAKYAEQLKIDPGKLELTFDPVDWVEGQPFEVPVLCSGHRTMFGRELGYMQFQLLVLQVQYKDGQFEYVSAEIPDGREGRQLTITMPKRTTPNQSAEESTAP